MVAQSRRNFLRGGLAFLAAPAIVRASSLMPIRSFVDDGRFIFSGFQTIVPLDQIAGMDTILKVMAAITREVVDLSLYGDVWDSDFLLGKLVENASAC